MATTPFVFTDVELSFDPGDGAVAYECSLNSCAWTANAPVNEARTFCGVKSSVGRPAWTLELAGFTDFFQTVSISRFLTQHHGMPVTAHMVWMSTEDPDLGVTVTATVRAVTPGVGGEADANAAFSVTLPVDGEPVFTDVVGASS